MVGRVSEEVEATVLAPTYDYYGQGEFDQGSREENIEDDDEDEEDDNDEEEVSQRPELGARVHVQFEARGMSSETSRAFCPLSRACLLVATISCRLLLL